MLCICNFNPECDIREVDPFGFVDLSSALLTGFVPSNLSGNMSNYNGIDNPESILGSPSDVFESLRMIDSINQSSAEVGQSE